MNIKTKLFFDQISDAEEAYQAAMTGILAAFRQNKVKSRDKAQKYKNEKEIYHEMLEGHKQEARSAIRDAEGKFRAALKKASAGLHAELRNSVSDTVPPAFADRVGLYRSAGIAPTKLEAEVLLEMSGKNPLAVSILKRLLDDMKAPVRLTGKTISDFEEDLTKLDALSAGPLVHGPTEFHAELTELLTGTPKPTRLSDGSWVERGRTWEGSVDLLAAGGGVTSTLKALKAVAGTWSADVVNHIADALSAEEAEKAKTQAEIDGREYVPDEEPASSVAIKDADSDVELARELGRESAGVNPKAMSAIMSKYGR